MPGPGVYVAVGVVTVVAVIAFKEFVYDPHIHPWFEEMRARRNRRTHTPFHSHTRRCSRRHGPNDPCDNGDDSRANDKRGPSDGNGAHGDSDDYGDGYGDTQKRLPSVPPPYSPGSFELDDFAPERQAWRATGVGHTDTDTGLRRRTTTSATTQSTTSTSGGPVHDRTTTWSTSSLSDDEDDSHRHALQPPLQPSTLFAYPASPTLSPARSPSPATSSLTLGSASDFTSSSRARTPPAAPPHLPLAQMGTPSESAMPSGASGSESGTTPSSASVATLVYYPQEPTSPASQTSPSIPPPSLPLSPVSSTSPLSPQSPRSPQLSPPRSSTSTPNTDMLAASELLSSDVFFTPASPLSSGSPASDAGMLPPALSADFGVESPRAGAMSPFSDVASSHSDLLEFVPSSSSSDEETFSVLSDGDGDAGSRAETPAWSDFEDIPNGASFN